MASVPNQAAVGSNSDVNLAAFGQPGAPGPKCALCDVLTKNSDTCKASANSASFAKQTVSLADLYLPISDPLNCAGSDG